MLPLRSRRSYAVRLNNTYQPVISDSVDFRISITPEDDLPTATSDEVHFDEDSVPDGIEINLTLSDVDLNNMLEGYISRLPSMGTLFAVNASGHRVRIDEAHNIYGVASKVSAVF